MKFFIPPALLILGVIAFAQQASAQSTMRASVTPVTARIVIDGRLDEAEWTTATPIPELLQREPHEGQPATEKTEVRLLYDSANLYIGVKCYDSEPTRIIGTQMARDGDLGADDRIEILIDTFRDRRNAFYFATNPAGALVDGLIIENRELNKNWDAIWNVRVRKTDSGWDAEFEIPFKSLTFREGVSTWGFNISRQIKRKIEEDRWASPRLDINFFQVSDAGEISGFDQLEHVAGFDFRPFVSGRSASTAGDSPTVLTGKAGFDAFYKLTPNLKLSATTNTDFAETEVDGRQINLTRFPLFFPEKRAFFLENTGVFAFSNLGNDLIPFFSRGIGLVSGVEAPILTGAKLTGTADAYDVGVLDVQTRDSLAGDGKNFFVGRVKRKFLAQSYIGGLFTNGNPSGSDNARTYGADLRLATSHFGGSRRPLFFDAYGVRATPYKSNNNAVGVSLNAPSDLLPLTVNVRQTEGGFTPALGFVSRSNVRSVSISTEFSPRPKHYLNVRQMFHELNVSRFVRLDKGQVESWRVFSAPVNYTMNTGDRYEFNYAPQFERLFAPFEIAPGVVLPQGKYRFTRWRSEFGTASKRPWQVMATWWFGTYWSGHADEVNTSVNYKPSARVLTNFSLNQTFATLREGSFVARIATLRVNYSISPLVTLFNLVQFDNESRNLGWQSRVRYIVRPGNEIFLVFNQGWIQDASGGFNVRPGDRNIASKIQYTFRF